MFQSRTPGTQTVIVRNPNYWNKPLPYLDQITVKINPDSSQAIDTAAAGQAEVVSLQSQQLGDLAKQKGLRFQGRTLNGGGEMVFNTTRPPFNDVRARRAVALALSPSVVVQSSFNGQDPVADTFMAPGTVYYDKSLKLTANSSTTPNPEAQKLFDQLAAEKGGPVRFALSSITISWQLSNGKSVQTQLAGYKNVAVTDFIQIDGATYNTKLFAGDFDAIMSATNGDPEPSIYEAFHTGGANNYGKFSDPSLDQALEQSRATGDVSARKAIYKSVQQKIIDQVPSAFFNHLVFGVVYAKKLTGFQMYGQGNWLWDRVGYTKATTK
jgi:peptide/nickel transport system substrate-binding protein